MNGPKLNRDWVGLRVRLKRAVQNGYAKIAAGTEGVVDRYPSVGILFRADKCPHCSAELFVSRMHRADFDIITPQDEWPDTRGQGRKVPRWQPR